MNNNTFERVVEDTLGMAQKVLTRKSGEYSSSDDKLHNFKKAKEFMRCNTKEFALWGMLAKHLVSVIDMIEKYEKTGELPTSNMIDEKIGDSINYFILLKACFMEDIYNKENKKTTDKTEEGNLCAYCENADRNCLIKENLGMKISECKAFIDLKKEQADMANSNNAKTATEVMIERQEQALIANRLWDNARKRLVVEKVIKGLKPILEHLAITDSVYSKIFVDIFNRAKSETNSVPDDRFLQEVIDTLQKLNLDDTIELAMYGFRTMSQIRDEIVKNLKNDIRNFVQFKRDDK